MSEWHCKTSDRQKIIEFALDLEENEEHSAENAAMAMTCQAHGISIEKGYEYLTCLPDSPCAWWLDDDRLTPQERKELAAEYAQRETTNQ